MGRWKADVDRQARIAPAGAGSLRLPYGDELWATQL